MIARICRYLSHLDGVEVAQTNQSGSHYFNAQGVKIRVSNHLSCSFNPTTTLNIMVDVKSQSFCVFYGNRIIPITTYDKLREFLRNFVMVCDILAPLADLRPQVKVRTKAVGVPLNGDPNWLYIGDLKPKHQEGIKRDLANLKKMARYA